MIAQRRTVQKYLWVGFFLFPSLAGLLVFLITPMLASLALTFYEWDPLIPTHFTFVGMENYLTLIKDTNFWSALGHTLYFIVGYIPLVLVTGLGVALLMNQKLIGRTFLRGAFFMPVISAWVAVALMWSWIFNPK